MQVNVASFIKQPPNQIIDSSFIQPLGFEWRLTPSVEYIGIDGDLFNYCSNILTERIYQQQLRLLM